ncbi:glycosyltransferase family 4 protein [Trichothermofontia sp.]
MRISFILKTADLSGGVRVVSIYAKQLQKRGHHVSVISFDPRLPNISSIGVRIKKILRGENPFRESPLTVDPLPPSHINPEEIKHYLISHSLPLRTDDVPDGDLVIATWWETAEWVANLPESKGKKVYFVQNYEVYDYLPAEKARASYQLPLRKITVSQWLLNIMRNEYGDQQVFLIPNSVDQTLFHAPPRRRNKIPTVGTLYAQVYWKGCDICLKAFTIAAQRIPNLCLIAFGSTAPLPELPLPANTQYFKMPPQEMLKDLYAQCDVWLFGSRTEGFGLPILEAMACRTPVVGAPSGAAPELLADGAGILVPPEDPQAMAEAIIALIQGPQAEWQQMSERAYRKATSYTWEEATDLFEAALYEILQAN